MCLQVNKQTTSQRCIIAYAHDVYSKVARSFFDDKHHLVNGSFDTSPSLFIMLTGVIGLGNIMKILQ